MMRVWEHIDGLYMGNLIHPIEPLQVSGLRGGVTTYVHYC